MSAATQLRAISPPAPIAERDLACNSREFNLLTACCRAAWNPAENDRIRQLLLSPLDWDRLLTQAEHHGLVPLLFQFAAAFSNVVPLQHYNALRLHGQQAACRALWFTQELHRILDRMQLAGIDVIAHKGPALASLLYGDVAQRQFNDLDLLIRSRDVARAQFVLADLGYHGDAQFTELETRALLRTGYEQVLHGPRGRNMVELQWRILPRFYAIDFDMEACFQRSRTVQLGDRQCRTLSAEDLLLALCVHAAKHGWTQLSWLRDIAQLTRTSGLAWHFIAKESRRLGIERIVAINSALCRYLFGDCASWPASTLQSDHATNTIANDVLASLKAGVTRQTATFDYFRWMISLRERRRDQARLIWRLASTPHISEWKKVKLPAPLFSLYPFVRMARLAKRFASGAT
ncbi:MAG TPA: nucleotidyltransferase family protein [Terriglobales bacterium]